MSAPRDWRRVAEAVDRDAWNRIYGPAQRTGNVTAAPQRPPVTVPAQQAGEGR